VPPHPHCVVKCALPLSPMIGLKCRRLPPLPRVVEVQSVPHTSLHPLKSVPTIEACDSSTMHGRPYSWRMSRPCLCSGVPLHLAAERQQTGQTLTSTIMDPHKRTYAAQKNAHTHAQARARTRTDAPCLHCARAAPWPAEDGHGAAVRKGGGVRGPD